MTKPWRIRFDGTLWRIYIQEGAIGGLYGRLLWLGWGTQEAAQAYIELYGVPGL